MSYSPLQARDKNGRWVAKGANRLVKSGAKRVNGTRKVSPVPRQKLVRTSDKAKLPIGGTASRGVGISGLKRNTIPYARVNKKGSTVGVNAGTVLPGGKKRIVLGAYARVEGTAKTTATDRKIAALGNKVVPKGSRRGKLHSFVAKHVKINNPAIRASVGGSQVRLGTSRGSGPTIIVRRGAHKTTQSKSQAGVQKYDSRMSTVAGKKAKRPRAQRRGR